MIRRILILRPDHLGDLVLFSGALRHIRRLYPRARITLCVSASLANYVELCPHVDRVISFEEMKAKMVEVPSLGNVLRVPGAWRLQEPWRRWRRWYTRHSYQADVLLIPVYAPDKRWHNAVEWIPARVKIGISGRTENQGEVAGQVWTTLLSRHMPVQSGAANSRELDVTRDFLKFIGCSLSETDLWPEVWTSASDRSWAVQTIPVCAKPGDMILGIAPGVTSQPRKVLPGAWYASVVSAVAQSFRVVVFGTQGDGKASDVAVESLRHCPNVRDVVNLSGRTTIRQMIEGLRRCDIVLAQETAALHLGVALHKPVIGILGGGHHGRFYPWGDPEIHRAVDCPMSCYHCNWHCRFPEMKCIQDIPPQRAVAELASLVQLIARRRMTDPARVVAGARVADGANQK